MIDMTWRVWFAFKRFCTEIISVAKNEWKLELTSIQLLLISVATVCVAQTIFTRVTFCVTEWYSKFVGEQVTTNTFLKPNENYFVGTLYLNWLYWLNDSKIQEYFSLKFAILMPIRSSFFMKTKFCVRQLVCVFTLLTHDECEFT